MTSTKDSGELRYPALLGWVVLVTIEIAAAWGVWATRPPAVDTLADDDPSAFSSNRAWKTLQKIARSPHPVGSEEHARVRVEILAALVDLGLDPTLSSPKRIAGWTADGEVPLVNIVCRIPGTASTGAVLLAAHYDSAPTSPGAGDDGAAVAALLEAVRALVHRDPSPLRNDLILLITDGEEQGLLGARGFVTEHPWAREVEFVLNFEARGNSGPSILFETQPKNGRVVREFARAVDRPVSSSLAYTVYQLLPNDTDFTIFKRAGYAGLNFAFIDGVEAYHSSLDTIENLSRRSLEHHGRQALALARHFGDLDLRDLQEPDRVFFHIPGGTLVHYPQRFAVWISALIIALVLTTLWAGVRRGVLTPRGILEGALGFLTWTRTALLAGLALWGLHFLLSSTGVLTAREPRGDSLRFPLLALGFWNAILAVAPLAAAWRRKRSSSVASFANAFSGLLSIWAVILVFLTIQIPATTYVLAWPLLLATITLAAFVTRVIEMPGPTRLAVLLIVTGVPIAVIFPTHVYLFLLAASPSVTFSIACGTLTSLVGVTLLLAQLRISQAALGSRLMLTTGSLAVLAFLGSYFA